MLAAVAFLGMVAAAVVAVVTMTSDEGDDAVASESEAASPETAGAADPAPKAGAAQPQAAVSLEEIVWTTDASSTLQELGRAWSIPRDLLAQLNPDLAAQERIEAGAKVVVYSHAVGASISVGPPNDGRLLRGVPLPEGRAWALPEDRTRAFATTETITAVTAAFQAYGRQFPEAEPIQVGDLSARRGGQIYGHQSHQSGRDVDIRLVLDASGDGFDAERNWFLVKTVIDGSDVRAIFLNKTEQAWLRAAAEADVGADSAAEYFALIRHEPGHTIHMHIRFACPNANKRCVAYSLPDTDEQDSKLPSKLPGSTLNRGRSKLPGARPRGRPRRPSGTRRNTGTNKTGSGTKRRLTPGRPPR